MRILISTAALFLSATAMADAPGTDPVIEIATVTEIDFQEVDVNARLHGPSMQIVNERAGARFTSLVRLRAHFSNEMTQSVREF